jgi:sugar diacid utilization regulator
MMNDLQKSVVIAFAENDMTIYRTAQAMHYHRNNIHCHLRRVREKTGLDPYNFFDLIKLYEMATADKKTEEEHDD